MSAKLKVEHRLWVIANEYLEWKIKASEALDAGNKTLASKASRRAHGYAEFLATMIARSEEPQETN